MQATAASLSDRIWRWLWIAIFVIAVALFAWALFKGLTATEVHFPDGHGPDPGSPEYQGIIEHRRGWAPVSALVFAGLWIVLASAVMGVAYALRSAFKRISRYPPRA